MRLIYVKTLRKYGRSDVLFSDSIPATSLGMGASKMNERRLRDFVRRTTVKGEGDIRSAFRQMIAEFVDSYVAEFASDESKFRSVRDILTEADEDLSAGAVEMGGGIGRLVMEWRWWANGNVPAFLRLVSVTGSGERNVVWQYTEKYGRLSVDEALYRLANDIDRGTIGTWRIVTETDIRKHAYDIALDAIGCVME